MNRPLTRRRRAGRRKGNIIVLSAALMIVIMALLALSVDLGYIYNVRAELDRAVDAGALAGASTLVDGSAEAEAMVEQYVSWNAPTGEVLTPDDIAITAGDWNPDTGVFTPGGARPSAIKVTALKDEHRPLFFARALGRDSFPMGSEAIATYQPRDMMLVLDYSGSMNDDSELKNIGSIGQANVEANLYQIWGELGYPSYGNMTFTPQYISSTDTTTIKNTLGLDGVPYPYASGSWNDFILYVKYDSDVNNAGYQKKYGGLTLVNYWLEKKPRNYQTADLWQVSAQPITAVKDAVTVFLGELYQTTTDDRLGLAIYNSSSGYGLLEEPLTSDFGVIETTSRQRQAAHYHSLTNIAGGLKEARVELQQNARPGAFKMIVLMTDGQANYPDELTADEDLLAEAQLCGDNGYPVVTISLGSGADQNLMQSVANVTGGLHFNIPGSQTVAEYEADLIEAFQEIAKRRPLKLVH